MSGPIKENSNDTQLTTHNIADRLPYNGATHSNLFELDDRKFIKPEIYFTAFLKILRINFLFLA